MSKVVNITEHKACPLSFFSGQTSEGLKTAASPCMRNNCQLWENSINDCGCKTAKVLINVIQDLMRTFNEKKFQESGSEETAASEAGG